MHTHTLTHVHKNTTLLAYYAKSFSYWAVIQLLFRYCYVQFVYISLSVYTKRNNRQFFFLQINWTYKQTRMNWSVRLNYFASELINVKNDGVTSILLSSESNGLQLINKIGDNLMCMCLYLHRFYCSLVVCKVENCFLPVQRIKR